MDQGNVNLANFSLGREQLTAFCQRHHIRKLSFFGSVLREDFRPDSDVDVLVDFEPSAHVGYLALAAAEMEFSQMLGGRAVDLVTTNALHPAIRKRVLASVRVEYAEH